ncbi:MAG: SymE family type I addiction module toxin [Bacteroidia bacterium]
MRQQKNQNQSRGPISKLNSIQTKHPHKKCSCGASDLPKPKLPEGTRRLKIQPKYTQRVGYQEAFPVITLTGKWLQNFGFKCDSYVLITEKHGQLIIQLETE